MHRCTDPSLLWCLWPSLLLHILCTLLSTSRSMQSRCDCGECRDRMRSSKDAFTKRRIQGHRHPATSETTRTITKPGPPFIPLKVFSSVLTERYCWTVTTNSWTSEVKSKCWTSLGLFWCRLTGLAFLLLTHTHPQSHAPRFSSHKLRNDPRHDGGIIHSTGRIKWTTERSDYALAPV